MILSVLLALTGLLLLAALFARRLELERHGTQVRVLREKTAAAEEKNQFLKQQLRRIEENLGTTAFALAEEKKASAALRREASAPLRKHAASFTAGALILGLSIGSWTGFQWGSVRTELELRRNYLDLEVAAGIAAQRVEDLTARLADSMRENREARLQILREREEKAMALARLSFLSENTAHPAAPGGDVDLKGVESPVSETAPAENPAVSGSPVPVLRLNLPNV